LLKLWYRIKCFFGHCLELDIIKSKEEIRKRDYDVSKAPYKVEGVAEEFPQEFKDILEKKEDKENESEKTEKLKRAWFNNGVEQRLVQIQPIDESLSLPDGWVKGKLKKGMNNE